MNRKITLLAMAIFTSISCNALNYFWVGGSGSWSDFSNHWATTSGGNIFHSQVPQATDNVFFDAFSFTTSGQTVTVDQTIIQCADMDWTGLPITSALTFSGNSFDTLQIYGSLALGVGVNFNFIGQVSMEAITGKTITTSGTSINAFLAFNGIGGSWTLQDALRVTKVIYLNKGTLNTNNQTIDALAFYSSTTSNRALNMGSSTFNLSNYNGVLWSINPSAMTFNAGTSTINGIGNGGSFYGGGFTYNNLFFTGSAIVLAKIYDNNIFNDVSFASDGFISGSNTFHDVFFGRTASILSNNTFNNVIITRNGIISASNTFNNLTFSPFYSYTLRGGQTQTVGNICAQGTGALPIRIQSSPAGTPAIISKASGTICWDYVRVSDITAIGGATFNAGLAPTNSQDLGGNTGLIFTGGCTAVSCAPNPAPCTLIVTASAIGSTVTVSAIGGTPPYTGTGTFTVLTSGTYSYTVTDMNGCTGSTTVTVTTSSPCIPPSITMNPTPTSVCSGNMVFFMVTATGTNLTYQWQVNQGAGFTDLSNMPPYMGVALSMLNIMGGTTAMNGYQYRCVVSSGSCTSISNAATLTVNPAPIVTVNSATICPGQTAILTASIGSDMMNNVITGTETYAWSTGATTSSISVSPAISTIYAVIVTRNDCSTKAIATVTVNPPPSVTVNSATICSGQTAVLTASVGTIFIPVTPAPGSDPVRAPVPAPAPGPAPVPPAGGALTYSWSNGATTNSISVSPITTTSYTVTVITNGCSNTAIATVTMNPLPIVSAAVSSSTVTVSATGGTPPYTGTGTFTGLAPGTYSYSVTDANGCAGSTMATVAGPQLNDFFGICYTNDQTQITQCCYNANGGANLDGTYGYPHNINSSCASITVCEEEAITFSPGAYYGYAQWLPSASPDNYYQWFFPANCTWPGIHTEYTASSHSVSFFPAGGPYYVFVYFRTNTIGQNGGVGTLSGVRIAVNVLSGPQGATINSISANPVCVNNSVCVSSTAPLNSISLDWGDGSPLISNGGPGGGQYSGNDCHSYAQPGIYTVAITSTNECGSSITSQQITVNGISAKFISNPVCLGNPTFFTNQSSCYGTNTTWLWNFGDGTTSTLQNPNHMYSAPGNYPVTLTVSDIGNSTSNSISHTITVNPKPSFQVIGGTTSCVVSNYMVSPVQQNVTYSWSTTTGLSGIVLPAVVNFNPSGGGTITITGTSTGGCSSSSSLYVGSCCNPPSNDIPNQVNSNASALNNYGTTTGGVLTIPNRQFSINGIFHVNKNLKLEGCTVTMGYLAKIIVDPGFTLTITDKPDKSHLYACNEMWDGIYLPASTSRLIIDNGTTIEDAINAVVSNDKGFFKISSTPAMGNVIFNKNLKSIVVNSALVGGHLGSISSTTIQCYDGVLNGNPANTNGKLHYPHTTKRSDVGVEITSVFDITIGNPSNVALVNTFDNLNNGIRTYNSSVNVYNNNFKKITYTALPNGECFPGIAICATGLNYNNRTLKVGSNLGLSSYRNTFFNCYRGVAATTYMNVAIWNNTFTNIVNTAVRMKANYKRTLTVNKNTINYANIGIDSYDNRGSYITINDNVIAAGLFASNEQGIRAGEIVKPSPPTAYNIINNLISNVRWGINASGLSSSFINTNIVNIKHAGSQPCYGISLTNSTMSNVVGNVVKGQNKTDNWVNGIYLNLCNVSTVSCNTSDKLYTGLFFGGALGATSTSIKKNLMNNNFRGLMLSSAVVGQQGAVGSPNDNRWTNITPGNYHTYSMSSVGANSKFYVRNATGPYNPSLYLYYSSPAGLQVPLIGTSGNLNSMACPVITSNGGNGGVGSPKAMALQIAGDSILPTANIASTKWMLKQGLYNYLQTDSSLVSTEPLVAQFKAYHSHHNLGKLETTEKILGDPLTYNASTLQTAQTLNNTVFPSSDAETNSQWMNNLLIDQALSSIDFTVAQLTDLRLLAAKCPYNDGIAVFQARTILSQHDTVEYINECEIALPDNQRSMIIQQEQDSTHAFKLYPNPNNGNMIFEYNIAKNETGQLTLYDITGRIINKYALNNNNNALTISEAALKNGVYFYSVTLSGGTIANGKFEIIK